jgi:hypothetical protein
VSGVLRFTELTALGLAEYEKLTADAKTLHTSDIQTQHKSFEAYTDSSGAIIMYRYGQNDYFDEPNTTLVVLYLPNTTNSLTQQLIANRYNATNYTGDYDKITAGYNIFKVSWGSSPQVVTKLN